MTFYKPEFVEGKDKKPSFNVKKNQIEGLLEASRYEGIVAGIVINFRNTNRTYFIEINSFLQMINSIDKKSFNEKDIAQGSGHLIEQTLKRVHYTYNVEKFLQET